MSMECQSWTSDDYTVICKPKTKDTLQQSTPMKSVEKILEDASPEEVMPRKKSKTGCEPRILEVWGPRGF